MNDDGDVINPTSFRILASAEKYSPRSLPLFSVTMWLPVLCLLPGLYVTSLPSQFEIYGLWVVIRAKANEMNVKFKALRSASSSTLLTPNVDFFSSACRSRFICNSTSLGEEMETQNDSISHGIDNNIHQPEKLLASSELGSFSGARLTSAFECLCAFAYGERLTACSRDV